MAEGKQEVRKSTKENEGNAPKEKEEPDKKNVGDKEGKKEKTDDKNDPHKTGGKSKGKKEKKEPRQKRRPKDTSFCQQRISAWQPILNAGNMLPLFFVIGIAFIPIGIGLLFFSSEVNEQIVEYTNCEASGKQCADIIKVAPDDPCICTLNFSLDHDFAGRVFIYYGLTNFYQNHRWYVKSRDDKQLHGEVNKEPSFDCKPYDHDENDRKIVPCGAIANSLFNDSFTLISINTSEPVPLKSTGIAWPSDKKVKFRNPDGGADGIKSAGSKPATWKKEADELDPNDKDNNGFQNEDFIVWMRTAALPDFRKLYRIIDHDAEGYNNGLAQGDYTLQVNYSFPVSSFKGTKSVIIATTSLLGGKNPFLGIAYIAVGCICLCLALVFLSLHIRFGKNPAYTLNVNPHAPYE